MSNLEISFVNFAVHSSLLLALVLLINCFIKQEYLQLRSLFLKLTALLLFIIPLYSWFAPETVITKTLMLPKVNLAGPQHEIEQQVSTLSFSSLVNFKTTVQAFIAIGVLLLLKETLTYKLLLRKLKKLPSIELPYNTLFKQIKSAKKSNSPYIVGFKEPYLVLPPALMNEDPTVLRSVFLHEEMHVKNGDNRMAVYERLLFCLYYWNPLYWLYQKSNSEIQELLADTAVIKEVNPKVYAGILLKLAEKQSTEEEVNSAALAISSSVTYKRIKKLISQGEKMNLKPTAGGKTLWSTLFVGACALAISCQSIEKEKVIFEEPQKVLIITKGDTLESISSRLGLKKESILAANPNIKNNSDLKVGVKIKIPQSIPNKDRAKKNPKLLKNNSSKTQPKNRKRRFMDVLVVASDTLESLSSDFRSSKEQILAANPEIKDNSDLKSGIVIKIPRNQ